MTHFLMMLRDLLDTFQYQSTNPDAKIGSHHVHQPETRDHFEPMNVELGKRIVSLIFGSYVKG